MLLPFVCHALRDTTELDDFCKKLTEVELAVSLHVDDLTITVNRINKRTVVMVAVLSTKASWAGSLGS